MEIWNLVDESLSFTGATHVRNSKTKIPNSMYYRVVEMWTITPDNKVLLTQRHPDKFMGLKWESNGGAVIGTDDIKESARRELYEETGIFRDLEDIYFIERNTYSNYIVFSHVNVLNVSLESIKLQDLETVDAKLVGFDEVYKFKDDIPPQNYQRLIKYLEKFKELSQEY